MKKALISLSISAGGLVICFGLCGLGVMNNNGGSRSFGSTIAMVGLVGFILSAIGIAVSLIWLLVAAIQDGRRQ